MIEAIQDADGFKYLERSAQSKEGGDGARLKYVCQDSLQNKHRKSNVKKEKQPAGDNTEDQPKERMSTPLPAYDCGGAIHVKFSIKRDAINVVYKHNPIHTTRPENGERYVCSMSYYSSLPYRSYSVTKLNLECLCLTKLPRNLPSLSTEVGSTLHTSTAKGPNQNKERKRKRSQKDHMTTEDDYPDPDLDLSTSPEPSRASAEKKRKRVTTPILPDSNRKTSSKKGKKSKEPPSPTKARKKTQITDPSLPLKSIKNKACIRCRSKKIKCNETKPTCNQCRRGLWTCQYEVPGPKKRSKNGCINCKAGNACAIVCEFIY
jgi:hypothetical protein